MTTAESHPREVWCVWTESGEYDQWSRDLRGAFATPELAQAHADQLAATERYDECEVVAETVLDLIPADVPHIRWSAHITPDGREDKGLGFNRGESFRTWSNEITAAEGRLGRWSAPDKPDRYIEVIGCDLSAVQAEYARLLALARRQLEEER